MNQINLKSFCERAVAVLTWVSRTIEAEIMEESARRGLLTKGI